MKLSTFAPRQMNLGRAPYQACRQYLAAGIAVFLAAGSALAADSVALRNWPSWRGPLATGVAPQAEPPVSWSETNNVLWKVAVPGRGTASPVVWEDQVFVLTAIPSGTKVEAPKSAPAEPAVTEAKPPVAGTNLASRGQGGGGRIVIDQPTEEQQFVVISYDRATGRERWRHVPKTVLPHEGHHPDHGYASASPVTNGEVLVVSFGSRGVFGYDLEGKLLWERSFGQIKSKNSFGEGSSPALHGNFVVLVWDHEGEDFIVALDNRTGREIWRKPREEGTNWTTPLIVESEGKAQVVVNSSNKVRSYDLESGEQIWEAGGQTANAIPTPVSGQGRVYVTSGFRGAAFQAIDLGRRGDLTATDAIAWSHNKSTPYVSSPLLYGDLIYFFSNNNAQLSIVEAKDGKTDADAERLEGMFGVYASPTGAAGKVYLTGRNGVVWVIKNGTGIDVLSKNTLDDNFDSTPALAGKQIFLRGRQNLYALADASSATK